MNIIIDTSAIIAIIANEPTKPLLIERTRDTVLVSPSSVVWEIGNAFSAMLKRNRITVDQAVQAVTIFKQIPIRFVDVDLEETLILADELDIYAYDAYLIRCAQKYRSPLLTLDKGLLAAADRASVQIMEV
jgi:predicted nucleic acid-binding protein